MKDVIIIFAIKLINFIWRTLPAYVIIFSLRVIYKAPSDWRLWLTIALVAISVIILEQYKPLKY